MSDDLLPIPMWRVSVKILCTCCGQGLYRYSHRSESEGNFDEATETDIPEMLKQQMDWAEADGWEVDHEKQTAFCDICVRMPEDARDRRTVFTRKRRVGYLGQGADTGNYDDWGYGGYDTWCGGGSTISHSKGVSSSYRAPASDHKVKTEFKDAAAEALARIEDHKRKQAIADGVENPPERHEEYDKVRDIVIDATKAMDKVRSLKGEEKTKAAIETNAIIKKSKKDMAKLIEALEKREADTDRVTAAVDDLSKMQVEIVDKHLTAPKAKKKPAKKKSTGKYKEDPGKVAKDEEFGLSDRVRLTSQHPYFKNLKDEVGVIEGVHGYDSGDPLFDIRIRKQIIQVRGSEIELVEEPVAEAREGE